MIIRGIDRMIFGLDIKDYKNKFKGILIELNEKKEEGHNEGKMQDIIYNNILFDVGLTGMRFYAYRIICKDFMIAFAEKVTEENPDVIVDFYSGYLWSYGYKEAYRRFCEWFNYFPGVVEKTRLSRLDICLDTDEIEFNEEDKSLFITRAKSKTSHFVSDEYSTGRKFSGFTIGRGNPMLARIYNKTEEIKVKGKEWFKYIWNENGWNEKKDVWRIEFQLRRGALKELGIDKVEDIKENEEGLWHYLTRKWFKMNHKKWDIIKETKEPQIKHIIRKKVIQGDIRRLTNQVNGLLISIGAYANYDKIEDVLKLVKSKAENDLYKNQKSFRGEVRKRRAKYLEEKM